MNLTGIHSRDERALKLQLKGIPGHWQAAAEPWSQQKSKQEQKAKKVSLTRLSSRETAIWQEVRRQDPENNYAHSRSCGERGETTTPHPASCQACSPCGRLQGPFHGPSLRRAGGHYQNTHGSCSRIDQTTTTTVTVGPTHRRRCRVPASQPATNPGGCSRQCGAFFSFFLAGAREIRWPKRDRHVFLELSVEGSIPFSHQISTTTTPRGGRRIPHLFSRPLPLPKIVLALAKRHGTVRFAQYAYAAAGRERYCAGLVLTSNQYTFSRNNPPPPKFFPLLRFGHKQHPVPPPLLHYIQHNR